MNSEVRRALGAVFVARTAANGGLRVVYPFLPAIARGLGVSIPTLSAAIAVRNLGGLLTPVTARVAETTGRRRLMITAMGVVVAGCLLSAGAPTFLVAALGIVMVGIAKPAFDVAMQAWFGDRVPFEERGRVFGITELTWAVALVVTVPVSGLLITLTSWRAPFVLIAVLSAIGLAALVPALQSDQPRTRERRPLRLTVPRGLVLASTFLFSSGAEMPFIVYGQWLEGEFGLSVTRIGLFTLVIVVAEIVGEGLVVLVSDRVGLKRMILGGLGVSGTAYAFLGATGASLILATAAVMAWVAAFEVTIVATIPFVSELAVESRDRLLSLLAVCIALGRATGALLAQPIYAAGGINLVGVGSALFAAIAAVLIARVTAPQQDSGLQHTKV
jgi:predicted MFS family arabinose efflux permease